MRQRNVTGLIALLSIGTLGMLNAATKDDNELAPDGKGYKTRQYNPNAPGKPASAKPASTDMVYHGGPMITGPASIHYIWYGAWGDNSAVGILEYLASNLAPSPYFNINTSYSDASRAKPTNSAYFAGSVPVVDTSKYGTSLTDEAIMSIVADQKPSDPNGVYFVLTSSEVTATSGFCTQYCGWHTHAPIAGSDGVTRDIKYGFVGNPDRCPSACEAQTTVSPNGNPAADGMASIIAHEISESVTDPDLNAWYDPRGLENADKCGWNFGSVSTIPAGQANAGAQYNITLGQRKYLIQQNWVNANRAGCAMSY